MDTVDKMALFAYACIAAAGLVIVYKTVTQPDMPTKEEILDAVRDSEVVVEGSSNGKVGPDTVDEPMPKPPSPPVTPGEAAQN